MRKRNLVKFAGVATAATVVAAIAVPASPANAARRNCGIISCTWYFNKSETSDIKDGMTIAGIPAFFIPGFGPLTTGSLEVSAATVSIALNHGQCLKVKIGPGSNGRLKATPGFHNCP
ncbi:hypothetical protein ACFY36_32460 [Actinoplanes sp. NPDC000266]